MPARAIGTATLSFGLVSIPVKVYSSSVSDAAIRFNMLEEKTGARVKQQYISTQSGDVVPRDQMIKGYEFTKGQYVTFTTDELKVFEEKANRSVEIKEFVPIKEVDPIHFEKAYYLGPDKGGDRAYQLLAKALKKSGRSALAKYAARGKQYLVLIRPFENGLLLQQLKYHDEIRSFSEVPLGETQIKAPELDLALQIVDQAVSDTFRPQEYNDEVRKSIEEAIQKKVEGQEITAEPAAEPKAQVIDLMEALKASLGDGGSAEKSEAKRKPAKKAPRKKAAKKKAAEG